MSDDMSDIMQKLNDMIKNNEIPDNIKSVMNSFIANSDNSSSNFNKANNSNTASFSNNEDSQSNNTSSDNYNIDLNTMLKMKAIIDSMNREQNDPRANLLRSLKPYLKASRKEKVDQYIKLFSIGKVFEVLNPLGGEKKNDV